MEMKPRGGGGGGGGGGGDAPQVDAAAAAAVAASSPAERSDDPAPEPESSWVDGEKKKKKKTCTWAKQLTNQLYIIVYHFCPLDSTGPGSVSAASIIDAISAGYAPAGRDDIIDALARDGANSTGATDPDNPEYVLYF
jgi:hypothetical protein